MPNTKGPWLLLAAWLSIVSSAFWWFEYRHWQSFSPLGVTFNGLDLQPLYRHLYLHKDGQDAITIVHFADQSCACNRYGIQHRKSLKALSKGFSKGLIQHVVLPQKALDMGIKVPASPSVAVWDSKGQLAYFGPYTSGAVCGQGDDFVRKVIRHLSNDHNPEWINMLGVGCYCPWQDQMNSKEKRHA